MTGRALILRLEAPLMAFGGPMIDHNGVTRRFPGLAQVTGLFANALGWHHRDADRLERLQERLRFASVVVHEGREIIDYQTVDLGQPHLVDTGWTTRCRREDRGKGEATRSTHIRLRHFRADSAVLVAVQLAPAEEAPTLDQLAAALDEPARPLFIGRKGCLPTTRLVAGWVEAADLRSALIEALALPEPALAVQPRIGDMAAEWPPRPGLDDRRIERVIDRRDWHNQFHGGERPVATGVLSGEPT
jgi:CRISPR system Cascade subunit CasD